MPIASIRKFFNELDHTLDDNDASFEDRVGEHMAYRAALYLIRGKDADPLQRDVDSDQLMAYAHQLKQLGIKDYARHCYGGMDPDDVDLRKMKYEYFLYHNVNRMHLLNEEEKFALRGELREKLRERERKEKVSFADHWLSRYNDQEKEPGIQALGEKLLRPNYEAQMRKLAGGRIDPERNITNAIFNTFRKEHPDKVLQKPKPEEIKPPAEEIGAPVI